MAGTLTWTSSAHNSFKRTLCLGVGLGRSALNFLPLASFHYDWLISSRIHPLTLCSSHTPLSLLNSSSPHQYLVCNWTGIGCADHQAPVCSRLGSAMRRKAQNPCPRREFLESGGKPGEETLLFCSGSQGEVRGKRHLGPQAKTDPVPRVYQRLINQPNMGPEHS